MLSVKRSGSNAVPSVDEPQIAGFSTTGLPDEVPGDFHNFMRDVLGDEPLLTDAELDAMYADYTARQEREAARAPGELPAPAPITLPVRSLNRDVWPAA
jgi:hypothetical protein